MMKYARQDLFVGVAMVALGAASPAWCQTSTSSDTSTAAVDAPASARGERKDKTDAAKKVTANKAVAADDLPDDEILVTGTRILRPNMTSNAPITVVDETFLRERGLARIEDALSQIPQVTPILGLQGNSWTSGRAGINLRRLGQGRTLTLLNGQRVDNDVNLIPGALIERIDILTGGASAVYGSDAVAGVVNFIVKRRFNGIVADLEASGSQHRNDNDTILTPASAAGYPTPQKNFFGGGNFFGTIAAGKDLFDKRVNISGFVTYKEAKPLRLSDIDNASCPLRMNAVDATVFNNDTWACDGSEFNPYNYFNIAGVDYSNALDGSRNFRPYAQADVTRVPRNDYIQRGDRTLSAGGFLSAELFSGIRLDGNFLYSRSRQTSVIAETNAFYTPEALINCDNPFLGAQQARTLCGAAAGTTALSGPTTVVLWRDNYVQRMSPRFQNWRGSAMLSGPITGRIRFEASYQKSRDVNRNTGTNIYPFDFEQLARGLQVRNVNGVATCLSKIDGTDPDCVPIDAFSANSKPSEAVWNWLTTTGRQRSQYDLTVYNGLVSGTLEDYGIKSPFATSGVGFALVAEQRDVRYQSGGSGAWSNFTAFDGRTRVREAAVELDVPLVEDKPFIQQLSVNGGYRVSDYSTYEKLVRTWKIEGTYAPLADVRFRASYNRALRVPVLERLEGQNRYPGTFALDLCAPPRAGSNVQRYTFDQCSVGMSRAQYDALISYTGCNSTGQCPAVLINGGNPTLQPERSRSITAGVVVQPSFLPGFTATVDWYNIQIEAAFEWSRWNLAFDQCYNNKVQFWCGIYKRDPQSGQLLEIDARYNNSGYVKSRGFDVTANYALDPRRLGIDGNVGTFGLNFNGTLATKLDRQFAPGTTPWSCLGYHGFGCGDPSPKWRHVAGVNWNLPWVKGSLGFTWRYVGATKVSKLSTSPTLAARPTPTNPDTYPLVARLAPVSYFDFATTVALTPFLDARFNVQNLFDKDPPLVGFDQNYAIGQTWNTYPSYYTIRGRVLRVGLTARF